MKGLLLKDYYLIRSVLWIVLAVFVAVGAAMAFLTTPWALTVVATVILGMISVTTIQMDKASGWRKVAAVLPLPRAAVVDSKYLLYLLLSGAGFLLGILVGCAAALGKNAFDGETMGIFSCISLALALLSGSVTIPLNFLWTEEKSMLSLILADPLSAALFAGSALLLPDKRVACAAVAALSLLLFAASWLLARRRMAHTGIV